MPLEKDDLLGTEKDGSKSHEYCIYCYRDGSFTSPGITLKEMELLVATQMKKMQMPAEVMRMVVNNLPRLKRWAGKDTIAV